MRHTCVAVKWLIINILIYTGWTAQRYPAFWFLKGMMCFIDNAKFLLLILKEDWRRATDGAEEYQQMHLDESPQKWPPNQVQPVPKYPHLILILHSIRFPACKCLGITCSILKESFLPLFRERRACRRCSKYDFTSTYGNPLFFEHFHI